MNEACRRRDKTIATAADGGQPHRLDGRRRRSMRTSQALIEAYLCLACEQQTKPGTVQLAKRAGCSERSIFERFGTLDELAVATFDHILQRLADLLPTLFHEEDRHNRIRAQVRTRAHACETWLPVWQVLRAHHGSHALEARIDKMRQLIREQLELVYRQELTLLPRQRRRTILIALEAVTDIECWGRMRNHYRLSVDEACAAWAEMIDELLPVSRE